jgi:hypothetical protein
MKIALALGVALLAACSSSASSSSSSAQTASAYACDNTAIESTCADYAPDQSKATADGSCDGKVVDGPCPSAHSVGTCAILAHGEHMKNTYYDNGPTPHTAADAKTACDGFGGTFTAAP